MRPGRFSPGSGSLRLSLAASVMLTATCLAADASVRVLDKDDKKVVELENGWVRLQINPAAGGSVSSFLVKSLNREMVMLQDKGLFLDHFYEQNWPGEFLNAPYEFELLETGPKRVVVRLTRLSTGHWGGTTNPGVARILVIKTLTLAADAPVIDCQIELKNTDKASKVFTYWMQHQFRADGDSGPTTRQISTRPSCRGLRVATPANDWVPDPAAGWTAAVDPKDRVGLVFLIDYNALWRLYNCMNTTSECFYDKTILPGEMTWRTRTQALLVEGLESVVYASPRLAADTHVEVGKDKSLHVEHCFVAMGPALANFRATTTLAWLNRSLAIGSRPCIAEVGAASRKPERVTADFPGMAGTPVIVHTKIEGDGWQESYELPYPGQGPDKAPGGRIEGYALKPPPKTLRVIEPPVLVKAQNARPRILHLRGLYHRFWRVEEATQALGEHEMEVSSYKDTGDIQLLSKPPWDYDEIMKWDLVVINNIGQGAMVGEQGTGMLKAYVENGGAVLFLGGPQAFGRGDYQANATLADLLPVELKDAYDLRPQKPSARLVVVPGTPLAKAPMDWGRKPPVGMWLHELAPKKDAVTWLKAGDRAALVTRQVGKGRVAVILLTPLGEPGKGEIAFWDSPGWTPLMKELLRWLLNAR